ncbi:MAG: hypothetical protein ABI539_10630 [Acidobacteriota bacterium]
MTNRIFVVVLLIFSGISVFLSCYAFSWLKSIGSPAAAVEAYSYYASAGLAFLWASSVILLIIANISTWHSNNAWPLWTSLAYFLIFLFLRAFWLDGAAAHMSAENGLVLSPAPVGFFLSVVTAAAGAAIVYFDQFLIVRLRERMYPSALETGDIETDDRVSESIEDE